MAKKFWQFVNSAGGAAELLLYGAIADTSWWGDEVTPKQFAEDLAALGDISELTVRINSVGGDVFAAHAIYNLLQSHDATVTVRVDGLAASAATIVAMAGETIIMPANSMMMIHNPMTVAWGYASDMRKAADTLDVIRESIISAYMTRTSLSHDDIVTLMDNETWMTASEAVEKGFATEAEAAVKVAASAEGAIWNVNGVRLDMSRFEHLPEDLLKTAVNGVEDDDNADGQGTDTDEHGGDDAGVENAVTAETLAQQYPEVFAAIRAAARAEGVTAERERQAALDALVCPETQAIVAEARQSGASAGEVSQQIVAAMISSGKGAAFLAMRMADAKDSGANSVAASVGATGGSDEAELASIKAMAKANTERGIL